MLPFTVEEALNDDCLPHYFIKTVKALIEIILSTEKLEPEVARAIYRSYILYSLLETVRLVSVSFMDFVSFFGFGLCGVVL